MGMMQKFLEKYHLQKWFHRDNLVILVLAGILLVVISFPTKEKEGETSEVNKVTEVGMKGFGEAQIKDAEEERYEEWNYLD